MTTLQTHDHGALDLLRRRTYDRKAWLRRLGNGRPPGRRGTPRRAARAFVAAPAFAA